MYQKGCLLHDRLSASRQDIIEKLGPDLEKALQNTALAKPGLQLPGVK